MLGGTGIGGGLGGKFRRDRGKERMGWKARVERCVE